MPVGNKPVQGNEIDFDWIYVNEGCLKMALPFRTTMDHLPAGQFPGR